MKMKKNLFLLALIVSTLALQACRKQPPLIPPSPPSQDLANNVCVIHQYHGTNDRDPDCWYHSPISETKAQNLLSAMVAPLERGTGGTKYKVLGSNYELYNKNSCSDYDDENGTVNYYDPGYYAALTWAKYDCRGIAVDTRIYGPYVNISLEAKKAEHEAALKTEGYEIAYVYYEAINPGSALSYIVFYIYRPDAQNSAQKIAVDALKQAQIFNRVAFQNANQNLSDTLRVATQAFPSLENREDLKAARGLVDITNQIVRYSGTKHMMDQMVRQSRYHKPRNQ